MTTAKSTLSGVNPIRLAELAKERGFRIEQHFIGLDEKLKSFERVAARVARGGHDIPDDDLDRRFEKSFRNAVRLAEIAHRSIFLDNSRIDDPHRLVLTREGRGAMTLHSDAPAWARAIHQSLRDRDRARGSGREPSGPDRGYDR